MDAPRRKLVLALSVPVTLLLLTAASGGGVSATRLRAPTPPAETVGHIDAAAGASRLPASDPPVAAKLFSFVYSDSMVLAFRNRFSRLGVSMDELMEAASAGNLAQYELEINKQRNSSLSMSFAIARYRAIMGSLHANGRCLDFVRQSTVDDPTTCGVEKWRRCCRGTANDADQVLLCAKHENLHVSPPFSVATHPANSFRVKPLPMRAAVRRRMTLGELRRQSLLSLTSLTARELGHRELGHGEEQQVAAGLSDKTTSRANVVTTPAVSDASTMSAATRPRTVPTTAREGTVLPFYFEDQFTEREVEAEPDDAWVAWCKEFLFYGSGCVEYCCTTSMAGSAVCNTAQDPDECI